MADDVAADASADVADDVSFDPTRDPTRPTWILTRPGQRSTIHRVYNQTRPGQRSTGSTVKPDPGQRSDPTRSTVRPDLVNGQPGQRSNPTRSTQPRPCCTRCHTRRTFWWRVRARVRVFLGNFGTYRFVSKFPTMWYIDLACLKLLQI